MVHIHLIPRALRVGGKPVGEISGGATKGPPQVFYHFLQGADLIKELEAMEKQDTIQQAAHACRTMACLSHIIPWVHRGCIRHCSVMFGVLMQYSKRGGKRTGQPFTEFRGHSDRL